MNSPRVGLIEQFSAKGWSFLGIGRLLSRLAGTMYNDFFPNLICMRDGWKNANGKNIYNFGECLGDLVMLTFDVTIG